MFIDSRPVLQLNDEATHFSAASFLKSQSAKEIWSSIPRLWSNTDMGPPDFLSVDQVSSYISKEMRVNAAVVGITM